MDERIWRPAVECDARFARADEMSMKDERASSKAIASARRASDRSCRRSPALLRTLIATTLVMLAVLGHATISKAASGLRTCDIYARASTPCVAAHSTTRALFAAYNGPLYTVKRKSDQKTQNIGLLARGDYANAAAQDAFCAGTTCTITVIFDQSSRHNDLTIEGAGGNGRADSGATADALPASAGGHQVYGVSFSGVIGYRNDHTSGIAVRGKPETMYMVTSGTHVNNLCCFDYGNAETSNRDTGNGHMDAVNFGTKCPNNVCIGKGPWVHADLENGLFMSDELLNLNHRDRGQREAFVTALLKNNGQNFFALKSGDAQVGPLTTEYRGPEPQTKPGYSPMHQEGAIVLGTGGDNSNQGIGSFFEGVMTAGFAPDYADEQVQADIVNTAYGGPTGHAGALRPGFQISLMTSTPNASSYLRTQENNGVPTAVTEDIQPWDSLDRRESATWIVQLGFADAACLSFESLKRPGAFLRHSGDNLVVVNDDGTASFAADSTFCPVPGLVGRGHSFQAPNAPGEYIRVYYRSGFIASDGGTQPYDARQAFKADASWIVTRPWHVERRPNLPLSPDSGSGLSVRGTRCRHRAPSACPDRAPRTDRGRESSR